MCGEASRNCPEGSVGDTTGPSAFRCEDDVRFFFRKRLGWLDDLEGAREDGRDCWRNDCAEAAALRLEVERPACSACLPSLVST